jgi:FMN phosphatase YigB (HAD superfamily)
LLDFDDTMIKESDYFLCIFSLFAEQEKIPMNKIDNFMLNFEFLRRNQEDIFEFFLREFKIYTIRNHEKLFTLYKEIDCSIYPLPGVIDLVTYCKSRDIIVLCLTNGVVAAQKNKWEKLQLKLKNYIKFEVAGDYFLQKPDIDLYKILQMKYSIDWKKLITIGDKFENDLSVPISLGAYAISISKNLELNHLDLNGNKIVRADNFIEAYNNFIHVNGRIY